MSAKNSNQKRDQKKEIKPINEWQMSLLARYRLSPEFFAHLKQFNSNQEHTK